MFSQGTMNAVRCLGLEQYVDFVVCGDDHGAKPKPNPDNALAICRALNVDPKVNFFVNCKRTCVFHMHSFSHPIIKEQIKGFSDMSSTEWERRRLLSHSSIFLHSKAVECL